MALMGSEKGRLSKVYFGLWRHKFQGFFNDFCHFLAFKMFALKPFSVFF